MNRKQLSGQRFYEQLHKDERRWKREIKAVFNKQGKALIKAIRTSPTGSAVVDELNKIINVNDLTILYLELYTKLGASYYQAVKESLRTQKAYDFIKKVEPNPTDAYWYQMEEFVKAKIGADIVSVTNTSQDVARKAINNAVTEAMGESLSVPQTAKLIEQSVRKEWRIMSAFRPEMIARTESITMANHASFLGATNADLDVNKQWLAFIDGRTRQTHIAADREIAPLHGHFIVGGQQASYPGDPNLSAKERVNCRCTLIYTDLPVN